MRTIGLFGILLLNTVFGMPITGPELIAPDVAEIVRCIPEPMQEHIHKNVADLTKVAKITAGLYKILKDRFAKNCIKLAKYLEALDSESLLDYENIAANLKAGDRKKIAKILNNLDRGFAYYINILKNLDQHLLGYVSSLNDTLNLENKTTIIDLINNIDRVQRATIELQEFFQLLSYLLKAYKKIRGYKTILDGMRHQLSFKIAHMVNTIGNLTADLRSSYLILLSKGDCSDEQISRALGVYFQKKQAIASE